MKKETKKIIPGSVKLKNPKWEVFCQAYAGANSASFGNGTQCYKIAFDKLEESDRLKDIKRRSEYGTPEYNDAALALNRLDSLCSTCSADLLRKLEIEKRTGYLLDQCLSDLQMDRERAYVARQREDLSSKIRAIESFDKVRKRVSGGDFSGEIVIKWADEK